MVELGVLEWNIKTYRLGLLNVKEYKVRESEVLFEISVASVSVIRCLRLSL